VEWVEGTPTRTARIDGITLASGWNPRNEALLQAATLEPNEESVHLYGLGTGELARVLLERDALRTLKVVILSPSVARWTLQHFQQGDWLGDPRVELEIAHEATQLVQPHIAIPACLRLAEGPATRIRDSLLIAINDQFLVAHFRSMEGVLDCRLDQARDRIAQDGDVTALFGCAAGRPIVVVAGGPTANSQFHWMREDRQSLILVATSTALIPLQNAGLFPDIALVFDPAPRMSRHFEGLNRQAMQQTPLVYLPTVHPDVLDAWEGPRFVAYQDIPRFQRLSSSLPRGFLYCSGTVTHAAVDLSVQLGGSHVILVGADFAHPFGKSHLDGAALPTDARTSGRRNPHLPNGHGLAVPSTLALIGYLRDLEDYIRRRPRTRFLNTGRDGAEISGAPWMREVA